MEEHYTELMLHEIRLTDPDFYHYIRNELESNSLPDDEDFDDGDDVA